MTGPRGRSGPLPVIAITGYLGAGKTSLLNHVLRHTDARVGVIVNDFGQLNVDATLIDGQVDAAQPITGGCICCLPDAGGLDDALARLANPRYRLDAILVETSGMADPITVARLIRSSRSRQVRLGGIVEVVDAVEHLCTVDRWLQPPARFAAATLVVIGKTDLLGEADREEGITTITARVRARNPTLGCVIAQNGGVDPTLLFDTIQPPAAQPTLPLHQKTEPACVGHEGHAEAQSAAITLTEPVRPGALMELLEDPPPGAYRIKGRLRLRGPRSDSGYLVNVVGRTIHMVRFRVPPDAGELVMIGPDLDVDAAQERLAALAGPSAQASQSDVDGLRRARQYVQLSTT